MKKYAYLSFKLLFFLIIFLGLFYTLEYGFAIGSWDKFIIPLLFSGLTAIMVIKKNLRRFIFFFSIFCFAIMLLMYLLNFLDFSKIVGNFGFSLLVITVLFYIPQIIKEGYIEGF